MNAKRFCTQCAGTLISRMDGGRERACCDRCGMIFYENPLPVVSAIVVNTRRELLLVKRGAEPYRGMWCLPMGFAETGEAMEEAALRELREETGLEGEITRLIDIDTVNDPHYGSIAIIAYEVRRTGGTLTPGDDAEDAHCMPIHEIPALAWESNNRAVRAYVALLQDTWDMIDSCRHLFADIREADISTIESGEETMFLSNILLRVIQRHAHDITQFWIDDVRTKLTADETQRSLLLNIHNEALREVIEMLKGTRGVFESRFFFNAGSKLKHGRVSIADMLNTMALSRKAIWSQMLNRRVFQSPRMLYATLELSNRIVFLYDRMCYHLALGYAGTDTVSCT